MQIQNDDIDKIISEILRYTIHQDSKKAYTLAKCCRLVVDLKDIEEFSQIIETIVRFDFSQNHESALTKLLALREILETTEMMEINK